MLINALVFDAYGTLFDVHSVIARCEQLWPGKGAVVSQLWRIKQLEYTWQRSLMQRYENFERVTADGLRYACEQLKPDPRVYQLAVTQLGVARESIGFVSSNCWDACGAKNFGFSAFWINRAGAPVDQLDAPPDAIIASLSGLAQHLA